MRNSSLVKCPGAENSTGLKYTTEAAGALDLRIQCAVGERSQGVEAIVETVVEAWEVRMLA